jgi:hypothetical protein
MVPTLAPLLALAAFGSGTLARSIIGRINLQTSRVILLAGLILSAAVFPPALQRQLPLGYEITVDAIERRGNLGGRRLLVISNEQGEGALVSEVALRGAGPMPRVIRGSKLLAKDDWMGTNLQLQIPPAAAIMQEFEDLHLDYVVVDLSPAVSAELPYWQRIQDVTNTYSNRIERVFNVEADPVHGPTRSIAIYRVKHRSPGPARELRVDLSRYGW